MKFYQIFQLIDKLTIYFFFFRRSRFDHGRVPGSAGDADEGTGGGEGAAAGEFPGEAAEEEEQKDEAAGGASERKINLITLQAARFLFVRKSIIRLS